jgi:hypothetical protein
MVNADLRLALTFYIADKPNLCCDARLLRLEDHLPPTQIASIPYLSLNNLKLYHHVTSTVAFFSSYLPALSAVLPPYGPISPDPSVAVSFTALITVLSNSA